MAICACALGTAGGQALAKTYKPNKKSDHAPNGCTKADCTLREAITAANDHDGPDTVIVRGGKTYLLGLHGHEDHNLKGDLDIRDSLKLTSSNAKLATIDAKRVDRVLDSQEGVAKVALIRLRIRGGNPGPGSGGGGVITRGGTVKVVDSEVTGNEADHAAGFESSGGTATTLKMTNTTISDNHATGAGTGGLGVFETNTATLTNVTITKNTAKGDAGGIEAEGTVNLNAVTIARNKADSNSDGIGSGGGIHALSGGVYNVKNSLIALNTIGAPGPPDAIGPNCNEDAVGGILSGGYNLIGDNADCAGFDPGTMTDRVDRSASQVKIGALAANGGPTHTIALNAGSQAINHAGPLAPPKDQRGVSRGTNPDIGAYER